MRSHSIWFIDLDSSIFLFGEWWVVRTYLCQSHVRLILPQTNTSARDVPTLLSEDGMNQKEGVASCYDQGTQAEDPKCKSLASGLERHRKSVTVSMIQCDAHSKRIDLNKMCIWEGSSSFALIKFRVSQSVKIKRNFWHVPKNGNLFHECCESIWFE